MENTVSNSAHSANGLTNRSQPAEFQAKFSQKRKRGRPRSGLISALRAIWPGTTRRTLDNKSSQTHALRLLKELPFGKYFCDPAKQKIRQTILAALGRFKAGHIPGLAQEIADQKMTTAEALSFLRSMAGTRCSINRLTAEIIRTIEARGHELSLQQAEEALFGTLEHIRQMHKASSKGNPCRFISRQGVS